MTPCTAADTYYIQNMIAETFDIPAPERLIGMAGIRNIAKVILGHTQHAQPEFAGHLDQVTVEMAGAGR